MRGGGLLVLALLAALVWAPPTAFAAASLLDPPLDEPRATAAASPDATVLDVLLGDELRLTAAWAGMVLVAGAVMVGLVLRRRRRAAVDAEAVARAAETEALLERRALRRAHVLMPEDPIVAAMALDEIDPAGRRSRRRPQGGRDAERG